MVWRGRDHGRQPRPLDSRRHQNVKGDDCTSRDRRVPARGRQVRTRNSLSRSVGFGYSYRFPVRERVQVMLKLNPPCGSSGRTYTSKLPCAGTNSNVFRPLTMTPRSTRIFTLRASSPVRLWNVDGGPLSTAHRGSYLVALVSARMPRNSPATEINVVPAHATHDHHVMASTVSGRA
jgi:hypothetical protein